MAGDAFPLMRCPPEIRNMIYSEALCGEEFSVPDTLPPVRGLVTIDQHAMNFALLRVSRQVSREATEVMLKKQLFVRVMAYGFNLTHMMNLSELHIPIVASEIKPFGGIVNTIHMGFAMTHHIHFAHTHFGDTSADQQCFVILHRHFHIFCRALALVETSVRNFGEKTRHRVEIHDPFLGTEIPHRLTIEKQEALVQPYRDYFRFFINFELVGPFSPHLAGQVVNEVKRGVVTDSQSLLRDLRDLVSLATQCAQHIDGFGTEALNHLVNEICIVRCRDDGNTWSRMATAAGPEFPRQAVSAYRSALIHLLEFVLSNLYEMCRDYLGFRPSIQYKFILARKFATLLLEAHGFLGTGLRTSMVDQGSIAFRLAYVHWLLREGLTQAEACLVEAQFCLPNNSHMAQLGRNIAAWSARGDGERWEADRRYQSTRQDLEALGMRWWITL
ncbi:hypothetical protein Hte_003240 [Hypoxylon texense]